MEINKYYTPEISDIKVGYEAQANAKLAIDSEDNWIDFTFVGIGQEVINYYNNGWYRTKYLTVEDILSEGWVKGKNWDNYKEFEKTVHNITHLLTYNKDTNLLSIHYDCGEIPFCAIIEFCYCPSINELRMIQKLLRIK